MTGGERELNGRVALVTGSARNIGRAIALDLAAAGACVMVHARASRAEAEAVAAEIRALGTRAGVWLADVASPDAVRRLVDATVSEFGGLDLLVNNASARRERRFEDLSFEEWREILAVTLDGAFLCSKAAAPHLAASGHGAIVNIGGLSGHTGSAGRAHVVAAKAGLVGLTKGLAHDLAPRRITVNCVSPGLIDTRRQPGSQPAHHATHAPLVGRRGEPQDVAGLVRFLCGPRARYITGQTLHANGGAYLG